MRVCTAYVFYPLLVAVVFFDVCVNLALGGTPVYGLMCLYAVVVSHGASVARLAVLLLVLGVESFFFYGLWGLQLVYLIPLTYVTTRTAKIFVNQTHHALFVVAFCLIVQAFVIDCMRGTACPLTCAWVKFPLNILLTTLIAVVY